VNIFKEIWNDQRGLSGVVVSIILVAVGALVTYGAMALISPKIRDGAEGAGDVIDDATSFTF